MDKGLGAGPGEVSTILFAIFEADISKPNPDRPKTAYDGSKTP